MLYFRKILSPFLSDYFLINIKIWPYNFQCFIVILPAFGLWQNPAVFLAIKWLNNNFLAHTLFGEHRRRRLSKISNQSIKHSWRFEVTVWILCMQRFVGIYGHCLSIVFYQVISSLLICNLYSCWISVKKLISKGEASHKPIKQKLISVQRSFHWKCSYFVDISLEVSFSSNI